MMKKLLSMVLYVLLLASVLPHAVFAEQTEITILTERKADDSSVSKPLAGEMSEVSYEIQQNGIDADASLFNWSVSPADQGISVGKNGNVRISGDTALTSFTLTASLKADSAVTASKTISVENAIFYDFDNVNTDPAQTTAQEQGGNVYMAANSEYKDGYTTITLDRCMALQAGQSTVKFKFRIPESHATEGGGNKYFLAENRWGMYVYIYGANATEKTFSLEHKPLGKTFANGITYNEWHEMKIEFDYNTMQHRIYVDGNTTYANAIPIPAATQGATQLKFKYDIDDITAYSGFDFAYQPLSISDSEKTLLIPVEAHSTATAQFNAVTEQEALPITWSLAEDYDGVTINPQTGLITVSSAASAGTVSVKAAQGDDEATATLTLASFYEDFENFTPGSPWINGSIATEGENKYLSDTARKTIRFKFPKTDKTNNLVLEADLKYVDRAITLYGLNSWTKLAQPTAFSSFSRTEWNKLKIVFDYKNSAYAVILNGDLIAKAPCSNLSDFVMFGFENASIDNVALYNVSHTAPQALNVSMTDVLAGENATLSYAYFDEGGAPEADSGICWYISDSAADGFQLIEGANAKTLATTKDMAGKYLKAVVTPAHADGLAAGAVVTGNAVEAVCHVLDMRVSVEAVTVNGEAMKPSTTNVTEESAVAASLKLETAPGTTKSFIVALVYYQDDKVSQMDYRVVTTDADTNSLPQTLNLTAGAGTYKIFVWDACDIAPLTQTISFT